MQHGEQQLDAASVFEFIVSGVIIAFSAAISFSLLSLTTCKALLEVAHNRLALFEGTESMKRGTWQVEANLASKWKFEAPILE